MLYVAIGGRGRLRRGTASFAFADWEKGTVRKKEKSGRSGSGYSLSKVNC